MMRHHIARVCVPLLLSLIALLPAQRGDGEEVPDSLRDAFALMESCPVEVGMRDYRIAIHPERRYIEIAETLPLTSLLDEPVDAVHFCSGEVVTSLVGVNDPDGVRTFTAEEVLSAAHLGNPVKVWKVAIDPPLEPRTVCRLRVEIGVNNSIMNPIGRVYGEGAQLLLANPILGTEVAWARDGDRCLRTSPYRMTVHAPRDWQLITTARPGTSEVDGDRRVTQFDPTTAPTYLNLIAGRYSVIRHDGEPGDRPVELWAKASTTIDPDVIAHGLPLLARAVQWYETWLGPLGDLDAFRFVEYDNTILGTQTLGARGLFGEVWMPTVFVNSALTDPWAHPRAGALDKHRLLLHEIAHTWMVGSVQPRGRANWMLSEGFCNYAAAVCAGELLGDDRRVSFLQGYRVRWHARSENEPALVDVGMHRNISLLSLAYDRGALVLALMEERYGRSAFREAIGEIMRTFAGEVMTIDDLEAALTDALGEDVTSVFDQLVRASGVAEYEVDTSEWPKVSVTNTGTAQVPVMIAFRLTDPSGTSDVTYAECDVPPGEREELRYELDDYTLDEVVIDPNRISLVR